MNSFYHKFDIAIYHIHINLERILLDLMVFQQNFHQFSDLFISKIRELELCGLLLKWKLSFFPKQTFVTNCNIHAVRTIKQIDKHFNNSLLGIQVLSMSKHIMNGVMCFAFDIGCHIYIQDTNSMHIEVDDLPTLIEASKNKYNRELIGTDLGQFHSDFSTINSNNEIPKVSDCKQSQATDVVAIESYFLMKIMYTDKLQDSTNDIDFLIRGRCLTQNSIN